MFTDPLAPLPAVGDATEVTIRNATVALAVVSTTATVSILGYALVNEIVKWASTHDQSFVDETAGGNAPSICLNEQPGRHRHCAAQRRRGRILLLLFDEACGWWWQLRSIPDREREGCGAPEGM